MSQGSALTLGFASVGVVKMLRTVCDGARESNSLF